MKTLADWEEDIWQEKITFFRVTIEQHIFTVNLNDGTQNQLAKKAQKQLYLCTENLRTTSL